MSSDMKWEMQVIAEEMAQERFGVDFYDLTDDEQYVLYLEAEREWVDRRADAADNQRKAAKENTL